MDRKLLIKIFISIILVFLIFFVYVQGKDSKCNGCFVEFKNQKVSGVQLSEPIIVYREKMNDLYTSLFEGHCVVKWDESGGYYKG